MSQTEPLFAQEVKFQRQGDTGDAVFTFVDAQGDTVSVDLSPEAQGHLITVLLATARARMADGSLQLTRPPIRALGFQPFVVSESEAGLEVRVHEEAALLLSFDTGAFEQLAAAVGSLSAAVSPAPGTSTPG